MTKKILSSERSFGVVFSVFFALLGIYSWENNTQKTHLIFWGLSLLVGTLAISKASILSPFNRVWIKFGEVLHQLFNPVILGIVFFGMILPFGLVMRLAGRDVLCKKVDKSISSYWISRHSPESNSDSFLNQF